MIESAACLAPSWSPGGSEAADCLDRDGFATLAGLVPPEELPQLSNLHRTLFAPAAERGDAGGPLHRAWPSRQAPWLARTAMRRRALAMATSLLGPGTELVGEAAILKPARSTTPTHWHQDEACLPASAPYRTTLCFWIALHLLDEASGCLLFVPGSHLGPLLAHFGAGAEGAAAAPEALSSDILRAVPVPLRAGEVVMHHGRVLHGAGPNSSAQARRVLKLSFAVPGRAGMMCRNPGWILPAMPPDPPQAPLPARAAHDRWWHWRPRVRV